MATKVIGADRLARKLKRLPKAVEAEIKAAMEKGADEIVAMAQSLAPVGDGTLWESIGWTYGDAPKGSIALASAKAGNIAITVYAGNDEAFYARWVEFGTSPHEQGGIYAGTEHPGTSQQPFFYPAYRKSRRRIKGRVTRAINKAAKRVAAGG